MRRNQVNCRKALNATDINTAGRVQGASTSRVTIPKEFNLSTRSAPTTPRVPPSEADSEDSLSMSTRSLQSTRSLHSGGGSTKSLPTRRPTPTRSSAKQWRPQLTVPKEPDFATTRRASVGSDRRRASSCPADEGDTASEGESTGTKARRSGTVAQQRPCTPQRQRPCTPQKQRPGTPERRQERQPTPERRRQEVYATAARTERQQVAARSTATASSKASDATAGKAKAAAAPPAAHLAAQERKAAAQREFQRKEGDKSKDKMMNAFRKPGSVLSAPSAASTRLGTSASQVHQNPRAATPLVKPPQGWQDGQPEAAGHNLR